MDARDPYENNTPIKNSTSINYDHPHFRNRLIQEYANFIQRHVDDGWTAYLMTLMFKCLPGRFDTKIHQMEDEVMRVYSTFITRVVRNPKTSLALGRMPIFLGCPDLPYPKTKQKTSRLQNSNFNDGLHVHGILLVPRKSRLKIGTKKHFRLNRNMYVTKEHKVERIQLRKVTTDAKRPTTYALKSFRRGWLSSEQLIVLPRALSELKGAR